jgi:hypothetical protein
MAEFFQNLHHADAGARKQQVHEARDEKCDGHFYGVESLVRRRGGTAGTHFPE